MTAKQLVQMPAYTELVSVAEAEDTLSRSIVPFYKGILSLKGLLVQVRAAEKQAKQDTKGMTQHKNQLAVRLRDDMSIVTNLVSGFAAGSNNLILKNDMKGFVATFNATRQTEVAEFCKNTLLAIRPHLPNLADLMITEERLQALSDRINAYENYVPQSRSTKNEKMLGTQDRDALFDEIEDLVDNQILMFAAAFKENNGAFYNKLITAADFTIPRTVTTIVKLRVKSTAKSFLPNTVTARVADSEAAHQTANDKGEITLKFAEGGLQKVDILTSSGDTKTVEVRAVKGKTRTVVVTI